MRGFVSFILLLFGVFAYGQTELSRQVISPMGKVKNLTKETEVSFTVGEAVIRTLTETDCILTQGFQQPSLAGALGFVIETTDARCYTSTDGTAEISNIIGCKGPYNIRWSNGSQTQTALDLPPGTHTVTVETLYCSLTKTFEIGVLPGDLCDIKFFNAFSPNEDGYNDTWEIENIESGLYDDNEIEIYNRWGQLVWSGKHYDNKDVVWRGKTSSGLNLPSGTYYYLATINNEIFKGFIELTR